MKLLLTTPCLTSHGGIHNILELANQFAHRGHDVTVYDQSGNGRQTWYPIRCKVTDKLDYNYDRVIIGSPHAVPFISRFIDAGAKVITWLQMIEHWFRPTDIPFYEHSKKFYDGPNMISSATWGLNVIGRQDATVLPTGINPEVFQYYKTDKDYKTVCLESPEPTNPVKDIDRKAIYAALHLIRLGYKIIGFGALPLKKDAKPVFDEYYIKPSVSLINSMYGRSSVLLKCTKYDFRSTAPLEAMTKGTVTVRAITQGDEDLTKENSVRMLYSVPSHEIALQVQDLLNDRLRYARLQDVCIATAESLKWGNIFGQYEKHIIG